MFGLSKKEKFEKEVVLRQLSHLNFKCDSLARFLKISPKEFHDMIEDQESNVDFNFEMARIDALAKGDQKELEMLTNEVKKFKSFLKKNGPAH